MTQIATVKRLLSGQMAEVEVVRRGACAHDCAKCGGCDGMANQTIVVTARNAAGAAVGDRVTIEGESRKVLGYAALVYALPLVLFFIGYALAALPKLGGAVSALGGAAGFVIGVLLAVWYSRRLKAESAVTFRITGLV